MSDRIADDAAERARALDPGGSFIVQAPAGAGKTELLTQRFLVLLARAEAPEEILALTFTRKAAGEMRSRIIASLERAADDTPPEAAHARRTWDLARAVLETERRRGWDLRMNPARMRIQTIDALCAALTRRMPVLSGFGAPLRVVEDASALYREAARQTLAQVESGEGWSPAIEHLLRHLDNNLALVEGLVAGMLGRRDQWLPHAAAVDRAFLEGTLEQVNRDALEALAAAIPADARDDMIDLLSYALGNLAAAGEPVEPVLATLAAGRLPGRSADDVHPWRQIAGLMLTGTGEWRARLTVKNGFPGASGAARPVAARRLEMKERMQALLARLSGAEGLRGLLQAVPGLPPPHYSEGQWETITALTELLRLAVAFLEVTFRERGEVDFTRIAQGALASLGEPERPTDLALLMDQRIQHILVDEFQDTSLGQYRLLEGLTAGWERGDGRTLFLVGDPMQSVYRFREAEVGLYLRARREGIGDLPLEALRLTVNHRSQGGIIEWVNEVFRRVLPASEDMASGAVPYTACRARHPALPGEAVSVHPLLGDDGGREAATVCALVRAALDEDAGGSVAVLVRGRAHLAEIVPALRRAGLRFRAVEIEHLAHRPVIQDLLALVRALSHPGDRVAWLAVLRAPWCGLCLADLHALAGDERGRAVWDLVREDDRLARLGDDGRARLERLRAVLAGSLSDRRRRTLRAWVEGTWLALGGPACVEQASDMEDARVFFDVLEEIDSGGDLVDRARLLERIEALYARPDALADGRLQIMTIHKAKGLEFDTVIVPGLGRTPRPAEQRLLMWLQRPQGDLLLAPIRESGAPPDPIYRYICELDREKARQEDGRLLYVAVTRARRGLHLIGRVACRQGEDGEEPATPASSSLLARLWPAVEGSFRAAARGPAGDAPGPGEDGGPRAGLRRLVAGWRLPDAPPAVATGQEEAFAAMPELVEFEWAGETARRIGTVTHRLLQQCARAGINDPARLDWARVRSAAVVALAGLGVPEPDLAGAAGRVVDALKATLEDGRGRWILDPAHGDARCEYALSGLLDGRVVSAVIDRCFVDAGGIRWIIDYKTGGHEGGGVEAFLDREQARYRDQLERYAMLLSARETRSVRLGLYFPLLGGWREWGAADPRQAGEA